MLHANTMTTFTLYRPTNAFMDTLNDDAYNLDLHRMRTMFGIGESFKREATMALNTMLDKGYLTPAATVKCTPEDLFRLSNTITKNWTLNDEVSVIDTNAFLSSTSVGDVFTDEAGCFYVVSADGFVELDREEIKC